MSQMNNKVICYIALGSNLENPKQQILTAISEIENLKDIELKKRSSLYQTKAVGPGVQPDFINAVIEVETTLPPYELLQQLLLIEQSHGRIRTVKWGPRTLDLDILIYDGVRITTEILTVPHPRMLERAFVLVPLFEIAPELRFSNNELLSEIIKTISLQDLKKI